MSMSNAFETEVLELIFNNAAIANIGDGSGLQPSATAGSLYVSLHSADPGEAATQSTNEVAYTNYARQNVLRSTGWNAASGGATANAALLQFPQSGATGATLAAVSTGTTISGATPVWHYGTLNSSITIGASASITPQFLAGALTITES